MKISGEFLTSAQVFQFINRHVFSVRFTNNFIQAFVKAFRLFLPRVFNKESARQIILPSRSLYFLYQNYIFEDKFKDEKSVEKINISENPCWSKYVPTKS
jgi:hypothetical protein